MGKRRKPSNEAAAVTLPAARSASAPAYAPALNAGFQATASRVQEMHHAISAKAFDSVGLIPGLSVPTRIVQGVHDAISHGVYAAVRHGGSAALSIAGTAERLAGGEARVPGNKERVLRGALNGAVGDALAASHSALAVQMSLHDRHGSLPLDSAALTALRPRVCMFLHGLACDEQSWRIRTDAWAISPWADTLPDGERIDYGGLLEREFGLDALWLRYNSGLAIDANAQHLAHLIERVALAAPQVDEWLLIGHSMGGLVARRAQALAAEHGLTWARKVPTIVCLGSPHRGAPLAKFGEIATAALAVSDVTRPLARIADARSRGIKDLRRGLNAAPTVDPPAVDVPALRLVFATLGDAAAGGVGKWVGSLLGDGLVRAGSAADERVVGDVQRVELAGLGHMALLNHPRVYSVIRGWLGAPSG